MESYSATAASLGGELLNSTRGKLGLGRARTGCGITTRNCRRCPFWSRVGAFLAALPSCYSQLYKTHRGFAFLSLYAFLFLLFPSYIFFLSFVFCFLLLFAHFAHFVGVSWASLLFIFFTPLLTCLTLALPCVVGLPCSSATLLIPCSGEIGVKGV